MLVPAGMSMAAGVALKSRSLTRRKLRKRVPATGLMSPSAMAVVTLPLASVGSSVAFSAACSGVASPVMVVFAPERIVTVSWINQDAVIALGTVPVGIPFVAWGGDGEGFLPWTREAIGDNPLPDVYDDSAGLPFEEILGLAPDAIIGVYSGMTQDEYDTLAKIAPTVAYPQIPFGTPWEETTRIIGQIMGKAATLNGRVGDVMISSVVHDEHSSNTYIFRNALTAADVQPFMRYGTVLDNQKALTVRSAFLQNREYMDVFYREGYTVMEMEAGPYLSAAYEIAEPRRHPKDELVSLVDSGAVEIGVIHYASDTPYSRRQSLLSKSMSYFGMESTYGAAAAIAQRIFKNELARLAP